MYASRTSVVTCPQCGSDLAMAKLPASRIPAGVLGPYLYCPAEDLVVTLASGRPEPVPNVVR